MPEKDVLILSVHSREAGNRRLLLSVRPGSARIHFTQQSFENPAQPPMFCMLLRKHLLGARLTALEQPPGERVLLLRFDAVDELNVHAEKTLALELMGKGLNLLLIGEDGRIIECLRRVDYEEQNRRALLPGLFYALPPQQDRPSFFAPRRRSAPCFLPPRTRAVPQTAGFWTPSAACRRFGAGSWRSTAGTGWKRRSMSCATLAREEYTPVLLSERGAPRDYTFRHVRQYGDSLEQTEYPDFSSLLDAFYARRTGRRTCAAAPPSSMRRPHGQRPARAEDRRAGAELLATEKREEYRRRGDLITAKHVPPAPGHGEL